MKAPERLGTDRLVLRRPSVSDADAIFTRYAADPEVTRFVGWPAHRSPADTADFLAFSDAEWKRWPAGPYLILERAGGVLVGGTGLAFETAQRGDRVRPGQGHVGKGLRD